MGVLLKLGIVLVAGLIGGRLARMVKLPEVTGYLLSGLFLGPSLFNLISAADSASFSVISDVALAAIAFSIGTASGVLMARIMNLFPGARINPLIGSAGVSAVPMAARVSHRLGMEADPENMLLMHAMGPNVAGVIGSAVAAGVLLTLKDFVG